MYSVYDVIIYRYDNGTINDTTKLLPDQGHEKDLYHSGIVQSNKL